MHILVKIWIRQYFWTAIWTPEKCSLFTDNIAYHRKDERLLAWERIRKASWNNEGLPLASFAFSDWPNPFTLPILYKEFIYKDSWVQGLRFLWCDFLIVSIVFQLEKKLRATLIQKFSTVTAETILSQAIITTVKSELFDFTAVKNSYFLTWSK